MAKKRYRPLDDFNQSLEDQELEQLEGFEFGIDPKKAKTRATRYSSPYTSAVEFETPEEQETYQRISKGMAENAYADYVASDPYNPQISDKYFTAGGLTYDPLKEPGDFENFWNLTWGTANEIHADALRGHQLRNRQAIKELIEEQKLYEPDTEEYQDLQEKIEEKKQDDLDLEKDIEEIELSLSEKENQVSPLYRAKAFAGQQEESSPSRSYFGSAEFAEDLGGGLSDIKWLGTSIALGAGAALVPTLAAGTTLNPGIVAGVGLSFGLGSAGAAYQMRSNESAAEMFSSYQERYANLVDNFRAKNNGENPTKEQAAALDEQALLGAEEMYQRNMALTGVDVAQIAIGVTPYGRILKGLGGPIMASKLAHRAKQLGRFGAIIGAEATLEGFEEAYQYLTKEQYKLGMYDQYDKSEFPFLTALASAPYVGNRAVEGMVDMYAHRSSNGLTNTKEFRNSTRAGMVLGLFMGGAMGGVINPVISKAAEISERKVLSPELEELSSSLSDGPWETMVNVDQISKKVDYITDSLKRNGGKNIMRAFRIFKEQQEKAGNPDNIEFDKVEKSLKTTIGLYNMHKNNNPKLADSILLAAVKGHEYLNYYLERTEEDIEKSSNEVQKLLDSKEGFHDSFTEKTKKYKTAHNLALEIKALEKLLNNTKEVETEAKKFKKYSNDTLVKDMINYSKKERTLELNRKKSILEAELAAIKEEERISLEEFENLGTLNDEKLIEAHASKIGNEINKNFLSDLKAGLVNPKQSFNLINHPFVKDVVAVERKAEEARKKAEEDKKKYEEGTKESPEEPIQEGDEVNYLDKFFTYMGKVGDKFRLKPLSKTGEEEILVSNGVFESLRKFISTSNLKSKIKEIVNKQKNNSKDTEDSNKGKQSAEDLEKRKKANEKAVEEKDEGLKSVEGTEPKVNVDITAYITEELQDLYRNYININVEKNDFISKIYNFFHSRSKKELEDLDVTLKVERNSIPEKVAKVWRRGENLMDYLVNNPEQAKDLLKNLKVKVILKDDKFTATSKNKTSTYLMNANQETFDQEGLEEYNNYLETFVNILNLTPLRAKDETPIKGKIVHANYGEFNNIKDKEGKQLKNRIDEEFRDELANKELVFAWQDNKERILLGDDPIGAPLERGGVAGAIYLLYKHIMEGPVYGGTVVGTPTKLNRRRINTKESSVLFDIYKKLMLSNVGEKDSFVPSTIYNEKGFKNLSANLIINFLLPKLSGINMDKVIEVEEDRKVIWGKLTDISFAQLTGLRFTLKGTATRLLFGANSIVRQGKVLRAQLYNHDLRKGISIFQENGKYIKQVYNVVGKEEIETFNISEEEAYAEMEKYFNEFVTSKITHQVKGPELNNSIFSFKGLQNDDSIEYFGVTRKKGEDSELYSNMLIEGEDPVLTTDVKKVGPKGNQRVQKNRQVVISPTDITTERKNVVITPEPTTAAQKADIEKRRQEELDKNEKSGLKLQDMKTKVSETFRTLEESKNFLLEKYKGNEVIEFMINNLYDINPGSNAYVDLSEWQDSEISELDLKNNKLEEAVKFNFPNLTNKQLTNILSPVSEEIFLEHKGALLATVEGKSGLPNNLYKLNKDKINAKYDAELAALESQPTPTTPTTDPSKKSKVVVKKVYHHTSVAPQDFDFGSFQRGKKQVSQFGDGLNASTETNEFYTQRYGQPIEGEVNDNDFVEIDANLSEAEIYDYLISLGYKIDTPQYKSGKYNAKSAKEEYDNTEPANTSPSVINLFNDFQQSNPEVKGVKVINHIIGDSKVAPFYVIYNAKSFYGEGSLSGRKTTAPIPPTEEEEDETLKKDDGTLDEESNLNFEDFEDGEGTTPQAMTATKELDESLPLIDIKEAREYLRRVLGTKVPVYVEEGLLRVGKKGTKAYGYFVDGAITLSKMGRSSVEYHEALHAVEDLYLTEKQIKNLNKETVKTYGEPSQENITEVMKDRGMSSEEARNYLLAEYRAEEYRAYELGRVDISTLSDTLKFWYDTLKNYITTIFKGLHSKRLYYKISQGQYARQSTDITAYITEEKSKELVQEENLRDLLGSEVEIFEAAKSMLYEYLKLSIKNINKREKTNIVTFRNLQDLNKFLSVGSFQYILNAAIKDTENIKDENQVKVLTGIKENLSFFISSPPEGSKKFGGLIPEMINTLGIRSNTEEEYKDLKDSNPDLAAIKAPFEFSALDSATISTKLLFEFFPQRNREGHILLNPKTGLPSIARGIDVFNKMQKILTNTPQAYNDEGIFVGGFEAMQLKLQEIAPRIPLFKGFTTDVLSKLTEEQQNQFFRVMNMKEYAFTAITERAYSYINREGIKVTNKDVRVFDAAVEGLVWSIRNAWKENYKRKFFTFEEIIPDEEEGIDAEVVIKVKDISEIVSIMKDHYRKNFYALKKEGDVIIGETPLYKRKSIEDFSKNLVDLLSAIGIEIPQYIIIDYIKTNSVAGNYAAGYEKLMNSLGKGRGIQDLFALTIPYSIGQMYLIANKNEGVISGEFDLESKNTFDDNSTVLRALAEMAALSEENVPQSTVKGAEGKTFWTNSLPNFIFNVTDRINSSKTELNNIMQDRWTKGSVYMRKKKEDAKLKINTFLTSRNLDSNKGGKDYKSLADREYLANTINKMFTGKDENRIVNFPTFADKSVWYMLRGASIENLYSDFIYLDPETKSIRIKENSKNTSDVLTIFSNYIIEEAERIQQIEEDLKTLDDNQLTQTIHYTKLNEDDTADRTTANGIKMLIFPSLNDESILKQVGLKREDGNWFENKDIAEIKENLKPIIINALEERIHRDLETVLKNNFIKKRITKGKLQGYSFINDATNPISTEIRKKFKYNPANLVASLAINTMIANVEVTKIFSGDIAYYKNYEDLTKRIVAIIAPGSPRRLIEDSTYTAAVAKDFILNSSKLIQNYVSYLQNKKGYTKEQAEKIVIGYSEVNVTDGQAYITLERWRDIMIDLGDVDRATIQGAYERLNDPNGNPTEQDVRLVMAQPLKGMVFTRRDSEVHGKSEQIPTYIKYSQAVLIPAFIENKADLGEVLKAMKRDGIDELIFESGIKEGALFPTRIADKQGKLLAAENITFNKMYIKNRDWKLQQPLSPHEILEQLEGSQAKKNILSDIKLLEDYVVPYSYKSGKNWKTKTRKVKGYELVEEFHGIDSALSDIEFQRLREEWGIVNQEDGYAIKNVEALRDSLTKDFAKDDAVAQKIIDLLDLQESRGVKEFIIPFDNNPFDDVIERKIASIITKRLVKLKMPGGSYIQTSAFGMTKAKRFTKLTEAEQKELRSQMIFENEDSRLDAAMWDQETGKAKGAQIFLPNYMRKLIPNNKFQNKEELKKYIKDNRLLEGIGYRIPNQGFSSIDAIEIVGFLPQAYGDTIIAYDEITTKTGSDFDIDKMYVMLPSFEYIYEKDENGKKTDVVKGVRYVNFDASKPSLQENLASKLNKGRLAAKALKNRKLELYRAILQSEHTFADVINPLDSVDTKNNSMFVRYLEAKSSLSKEEIETIERYISTDKKGNYVFSDNFYSEVNKIITLKEQEDLEWFSLTKQLKIREIYLGGQFGVGQLARHKVDQAISQYSPGWKEQGLESPYYFAGEDFGIGNITPQGSSDLSQSKLKDSDIAIATIISARLDAYVDIAKDPYIFYINNNAITANTVALMDRLGTDPQWTDLFMSLPAIKNFVTVTKSINSGNMPTLKVTEEGKTEVKTFSNAENYITARFQQAINDRLKEDKKKESTSDIGTFNLMTKKGRQSSYNLMNNLPKETETEGRILVEDLYTVKALSKFIDSSLETTSLNNLYSQLALFKYFIDLKTKATILNKGVTASKYDTQGARGGFAQGIIFDELFADILETNLAGFANRFNSTMAGKYREHGPELLKKLFGDRFLLGNDNYKGILKRIAVNTRHLQEFKEKEEYIRNLHRSFRSFLYTETEYFKSINIEDLLYSSNNIEVRLSQAQLLPELENNLLLKYLQPVGKTFKNGSAFISAPARLAKSGKQKNDLTSAWRDLLYNEDPKIRKLGEDLYKASLLFSGYRNGSFTFQELAPLEYEIETGIYDQFGEIASMLKAEGDPNNEYIQRFIMSQMTNPDIVPEADYDVVPLKRNPLSKHELLLSIKEEKVYKYLVSAMIKEKGEIKAYPEFVPFISYIEGNTRRLYKFEGLKNKGNLENPKFVPLYSMMEAFNYTDKGQQVYEPVNIDKGTVIKKNIKVLKVKDEILQVFRGKDSESVKFRENLNDFIEENRDVTPQDIFYKNEEYQSIAPWTNIYTEQPVLNDIEETPTIYEGNGLNPKRTLDNAFTGYIDSNLRTFSSIEDAVNKGMSVENATQLAVKYNLDLQAEVESLPESLDFENSFSVNYDLAGYGIAIQRAKKLLGAGVIGYQEIKRGSDTFYINTKPIEVLLEEVNPVIESKPYLKAIKDFVGPKVDQSNMEVVTVVLEDKVVKRDVLRGLYATDTSSTSPGVILMKETKDRFKNAITLLHEILHVFTIEEVLSNTVLRAKIKSLLNLYSSKYLKTAPGGLRRVIEEYQENPKDEELERLALAEFITYGLTDLGVVGELKKLKIKKEAVKEGIQTSLFEKIESAFDALIQVVLDTFGYTEKNLDASAYDLLLNTVGEVITQASNLKADKKYAEQQIIKKFKEESALSKLLNSHSTALKNINTEFTKKC